MTYFAKVERLIDNVDLELIAFGVTRGDAPKDMKIKAFPYQHTLENMGGHFGQLTPGYMQYMEWLEDYRHNIHLLEYHIKKMRKEFKGTVRTIEYDHVRKSGVVRVKRQVRTSGTPYMLQPEYQSYLARMANSITKLIWLRRAGKAWRNATIAKQRQELAA
jgi:hypothetical protein